MIAFWATKIGSGTDEAELFCYSLHPYLFFSDLTRSTISITRNILDFSVPSLLSLVTTLPVTDNPKFSNMIQGGQTHALY